MSQPRFDTGWVSGICELGPRPLVVTGWLRLWLTAHFSDTDLMEDQSQTITKMLWKADKTTNIVIESVTAWIPEMTEFRPGIIIKRNDWTRIRLGIDDRMMGTMEIDGQNRYANFWQGSHTLFCITGEGAETEKLAAEVFRELNEFGKVIRTVLDLRRFEVASVGALAKLDKARENFVVPITVAYIYEEGWKLNLERPVLRRLDMSIFQP